MRLLATCWLLAAALVIAGWSGKSSASGRPAQRESAAGPVADYASLVASLRAAGARVSPGQAVAQPFFSVPGKTIRVHGEDVQVFEYTDAALAEAQASRISPTGSTVGTTKVHWMGPPHFYRKGKLLVLYVGGDDQVLKALQAALGRQFAGQ
jgi:hypothetical protein